MSATQRLPRSPDGREPGSTKNPPLAVLTGGGGAIAAHIAHRLDDLGYRLVLIDLVETRMAELADNLSRPPQCVVADLSDAAQLRAVGARIEGEWADLALLVNNAGLIEVGDIVDLAPEALDRHILVNLLAPMQLTRAAARAMATHPPDASGRRGDIVTLVSMGGIVAMPGSASYAASKFGLRGFQTSVRAELAPLGIRVMGIFPSGVDTRMLAYEATHGGASVTFLGRPLAPQAVADAVVRVLRTGAVETYLPYHDGLSGRLVSAFPSVIPRLLPLANRLGERGRARYRATHGL